MQLRVVTDQPWDVPADVLVVPVAAEPAFDGPLGELDRRAGGELQALADVRRADRQALSRRRSRPAASCRRAAAGRRHRRPGDSSTASRSSASRPPPSGASAVGRSRLAIWLTPLASPTRLGRRRRAAVVAELVARGVVEGSYDPQTIYRDEVDVGAAGARRADPRRAGRATPRP